MKALERIDLLDRIGRELQSRFTFGQIADYFKAIGVDTTRPTSNANSKWVYSRELLANEPDDVIVRIADELEVPHNHTVVANAVAKEATFWQPLHFKLFLSHLSSFKQTTGLLQAALRRYGISAFVAHVDIEPTKEWLDEIEAGLYSMDALAAILMPGFKESNWTDQEVGVAVGRGVLIIPIMRGLPPHGFISKYQGLQALGKKVPEVADAVFRIILGSPKTRSRMLTCLVETTLRSTTADEAMDKLAVISSANVPTSFLERLREGAASSSVLSQGTPLGRLNELLSANGLRSVVAPTSAHLEDEDIPF